MEIYCAKEVAEILKVHPQTVRKLIERGELESFKIGNDYRVTAQALADFCRPKEDKQE